jgi:hypothetical protein
MESQNKTEMITAREKKKEVIDELWNRGEDSIP